MKLEHNPLVNPTTEFPDFQAIQPQHIQPAIEYFVAAGKACVEQISALAPSALSWETLVTPLEQIDDALNKAWAPVSHLNSVMSNDELREAHDACLSILSDYGTFVGQHEGLYQAYVHFSQSEQFQALDAARQRVITETLKDFKLSGVALPPTDKKRYGEIQARLSALSSQFSHHVLDATHAWVCHVESAERLQGLPESALTAAAAEAKQRDKTGWVFTLDIPSYLPVMMYAEDRSLREELYRAYVTRASELGPTAGTYDNTALMEEILSLRHELATLLGFKNYAALSVASKMAESVEQVQSFLEGLAARSKPQAEQEFAEVEAFAKQAGLDRLEAWDVAFYSEQLKQKHYQVSDEQLRPYFPETQVLKGLFTVAEKLFSVQFRENTQVKTWHPEARFFEVLDTNSKVIAGFYLDLYARAKKRGGAWMADYQTRRSTPEGIQLPIAFLTCNFNRPQGDTPALFTHDEVITLFHEFGHGLHHMLTEQEVSAISGINGVPWDAVELPSQFLENWCWEKEALAYISKHYQTGEALPEALLKKMLAAKNFQSAMQMVRQLEFSLFDLAIHSQADAAQPGRIQALLNEVRVQVAVVQPPAFNRFQHSFGHIFAGGYAAGYYSYKWAEVLSADAFSRFEEEGIFNRQTGQDFLNCILSKGGSAPIEALFAAFRGRPADISALLRHSGIAEQGAA